jgi:isoquinoline 1-oxidoreductase beta subunit
MLPKTCRPKRRSTSHAYSQPFFADLPKGLRALAADTIDAGLKLERRDFLKLATASGFALGVFPAAVSAQAKGNEQVSTSALKPYQQPSAFVKIDRDGAVTITINRLEFGQGVQTGLPMVLAEELDADWSKVQSVHGNADPAYLDPVMGMHLTGGSTAIKNSYVQYRELGRVPAPCCWPRLPSAGV